METLAGYQAVLENVAIRACVPLAVACAIVLLIRKASAARRHLVWTIALAAAVILPAAALCLPAWEALPSWTNGDDVAPSVMNTTITNDTVATEDSSTLRTALPTTPSISREAWNWPLIVVSAWLLVTSVMAFRIIVGVASLWRLEGKDGNIEDEILMGILRDLRSRLGIHRDVKLLSGASQAMPMTWGVIRPRILLPAICGDWTVERQRVVLAHEVCHIRRCDPATQLLAELARAIYWFNPLVWLAVRRLNVERERACDDMVLSLGTRASEYAEELFAFATGFNALAYSAATGIAMARTSKLEGRLCAILDATRDRRRATKRAMIAGGIALLVALPPLAMLRTRAAIAADAAPTTLPTPEPAQTQFIRDRQETLNQETQRIRDRVQQVSNQQLRLVDEEIKRVSDEALKAVDPAEIQRCTEQLQQLNQKLKALGEEVDALSQLAATTRPSAAVSGNVNLRPTQTLPGDLLTEIRTGVHMPPSIVVRPMNGVWKATLSDGVEIELLGIAENPSRGRPWWKPDGSPLAPRPYEKLNAVLSLQLKLDCTYREIAIRLTNPNSAPIDFSWDISPSTYTWNGQPNNPTDKGIHGVGVEIPATQKTISLRLGAAIDKWKTSGEQTVPVMEADMASFNSAGEIVFAPASDSKGGAVAVVACTINYMDMRVIAVGKDGKEHTTSEMTNGGTPTLHQISARFEGLPLDEVSKFELQTRLFEWVTFNDIAVNPK